jgi:hypothetical protein
MGTDSTWVGKKPLRRIGGMADALSIAADLGFSVPPPPTQVGRPTSLSLSLCMYEFMRIMYVLFCNFVLTLGDSDLDPFCF